MRAIHSGSFSSRIASTGGDLVEDGADVVEHAGQSLAQWRNTFKRSPALFLGAAIGGGIVLALLARSHSSAVVATAAVPRARSWGLGRASAPAPAPSQPGVVGQAVGAAIQGAVFAVAASQARLLLARLVPTLSAEDADEEQQPRQRN